MECLQIRERDTIRISNVIPYNGTLPDSQGKVTYKILEKLGEGAQFEVWNAVRSESGLEVAVKIALPGSPFGIRERREEEFYKLLASLPQWPPNILKMYITGNLPDGRVARVIEKSDMVNGRPDDLAYRLRQGKSLGISESNRIIEDILTGLEVLAQYNCIHRDIKPENILFVKGRATITDFGIAKVEGTERMTKTGQSMGTLGYMSPEQLRGIRDLTPKSDLFAAACTWYEMLTGKSPFPVSSDLLIVTQAVCTGERPNPSRLNPRIEQQLAELVMNALAVNPEERPTSTQLKKRIKEYAAGYDPKKYFITRAFYYGKKSLIPALVLAACIGAYAHRDELQKYYDRRVAPTAQRVYREVKSRIPEFDLKKSKKTPRKINTPVTQQTNDQ